jgi:DNA-binding protein
MSENSDIIYIGRKPVMSYVLAVITSFSGSDAKKITLKARGQAITTAVDVAEITRRRFLKELKIGKISIGTEEMPPREAEGRPRMVSTMEIILSRK